MKLNKPSPKPHDVRTIEKFTWLPLKDPNTGVWHWLEWVTISQSFWMYGSPGRWCWGIQDVKTSTVEHGTNGMGPGPVGRRWNVKWVGGPGA